MLDTSAVLAWLRGEPGAEVVDPLLGAAVMSAANWSQTWQKLHQHGVDADRATRRLRVLGVRVEPLTAADSVTAERVGCAAVTADTAWAQLPLDDLALTVRLIR
ncbi:MAG: ribonuclease VapC [Pseudonocardiales bacterium]|nr:ribonuclease VapC [Pseudonocardiales bacterium]